MKNKRVLNKIVRIIGIVLVLVVVFLLGMLAENYLYFSHPTIPSSYTATQDRGFIPIDKPVIYLYPKVPMKVKVKLNFAGKIQITYPTYNTQTGWDVLAYPDGTLINLADNRQYAYLFWEGIATQSHFDMTTGFIVKGSDTKQFLQNELSTLGLTPKEYNDFIVYWLPQMENNKYNLIHFASQEYTSLASLQVTPKPDSVLRIFMVYKPLNKSISITPQFFSPFFRNGFTVVEWGGTEIN